jgi:hypothetical protein
MTCFLKIWTKTSKYNTFVTNSEGLSVIYKAFNPTPVFSFFLCHFLGYCRSHGNEKLPHRNILQQ